MPDLSNATESPIWPGQYDHSRGLIAECMAAVRAGIEPIQKDPLRPQFHFLPPARWMNDVFGAVFHNGWYHIFYGLNPYHDRDDEFKCFGHARSRDLLHWEHLRVALAPLPEQGQLRCNDGTLAFDNHGRAMLFFTFVPLEAAVPRQHWLAYGDQSLENWSVYPGNPVLSMENHGGPRFKNIWTDPYIFSAGRRTFMTISKCLPEDGSPGVLPLYEALDPSLLRWKYRGLFHDRTGEVVNFFQLQDRWVLLRSPFCDIEYETGQFDMNELRFNPCTAGKLAYGYIRQNNPTSRGLYASDVYSSPDDRRILVGWISGFPEGRGWNGCMSLPRVLTIDTAGRLCQHPLPELSRLRGTPHVMEDRVVENGDWSPARTFSPSIEISLKLRIDTARQAGLRLRNRGQKEGGLELSCDRDGIQFNSLRIPVDRPGSSPFDLRLFVDRLVVEAFINQGSLNVTQCIPLNGEELEIEFFARGGAALLNGTVWPMKSIWQDGTGRLGAG